MNGGQINTSGNQHSKKSIERITQIQKLPPSSPLQTPPPLLSIKAAGLERESAIANRQSSLFPTARNIIPNLSRYLFAATKATTASTAQQSTKIGVVKVAVATGNNNKDKNTEQQTLTIVPKSYSNANDTGAENVPNQASMTNNNATTTKSKVREKGGTDEEEFEDDEEKEQDEQKEKEEEEDEEEEEEGEGDEKQKDVRHVYGIPLNPIKLDRVCAACYGEEKFPDDEPILLCDGAGCVFCFELSQLSPSKTRKNR